MSMTRNGFTNAQTMALMAAIIVILLVLVVWQFLK
jgi:cytochrome oxidase assembly protein ShyY1